MEDSSGLKEREMKEAGDRNFITERRGCNLCVRQAIWRVKAKGRISGNVKHRLGGGRRNSGRVKGGRRISQTWLYVSAPRPSERIGSVWRELSSQNKVKLTQNNRTPQAPSPSEHPSSSRTVS